MYKMNADKACEIILNEDSDMCDINDDSDVEFNNTSCMDVNDSDTDKPNASSDDSADNDFVTAQVTFQHPGPLWLRDLRGNYVWQLVIQ